MQKINPRILNPFPTEGTVDVECRWEEAGAESDESFKEVGGGGLAGTLGLKCMLLFKKYLQLKRLIQPKGRQTLVEETETMHRIFPHA
jgi:hypothetical protein